MTINNTSGIGPPMGSVPDAGNAASAPAAGPPLAHARSTERPATAGEHPHTDVKMGKRLGNDDAAAPHHAKAKPQVRQPHPGAIAPAPRYRHGAKPSAYRPSGAPDDHTPSYPFAECEPADAPTPTATATIATPQRQGTFKARREPRRRSPHATAALCPCGDRALADCPGIGNADCRARKADGSDTVP